MPIELIKNQSTNIEGAGFPGDGGSRVIVAFATSFGTASVALEGSPDGENKWIPVLDSSGTAVSYSADTIRDVGDFFAQGMHFRGVITGATGGESNINLFLF